ncbi:MAG TPA: molybdate ABC transporter permease subunit [Hyphomicrobiaceae bacterium]|nr:molybdate ABC transporter permease subunit [Hyphomicrobiaceae bacterium]
MDWIALWLSLRLGVLTVIVLLPIGVGLGRVLAYRNFRGKELVEAIVALPLVLPPTVFGYYLLVAFGGASPVGQLWQGAFGHQLVFTFEGLLVASVIFNLPFAIQPMQRAFEAIPIEVREAAQCCGMSPWQTLRCIELPLAWPGILTALVLSFAHTLGEFGIVLMVGGSIPGETKTIAIAIYDRVQAFDDAAAGRMSALLLALSLVTIAATFYFSARVGRRLG